jgi:FSR family fosmidomycin resistance protein-like MFS transporter
MSLLLDAIFSSVAFSHLSVDLLNSTRAILLVFLSKPLGLTNASIGLISAIFITTAALAQPIFGHLADRTGSRWIVVGGVLWTATFFSLALIIPGRIALVFLILSSFGSGAFHPVGVMLATVRGRTHFAGREATAASFFFLFGRLGFFLGPLLGGLLLNKFGLLGLLVLAVPALPIGLYAAKQLKNVFQTNRVAPDQAVSSRSDLKILTFPFLAFILIAAFQSTIEQNMFTYVPKYLSDLGQSVGNYGMITSLFMGGSAVGDIFGSVLADKYGKRRVALVTFTLAGLPLLVLPWVGTSLWLLLLMPLAGAFIGAAHSIIIVRAQRIIPGGMALASGLVMGFMFSSGALGTFFSGQIADLFGFRPVFYMTGIISLVAAGLSLTLEDKNKEHLNVSPQ